jgi:UDP-N-acetyl-D-glucosamine dehydrogenase
MFVIGIIGLGYVGLPLAVEFARSGRCVLGFDHNVDVSLRLRRGESHVLDVSSVALKEALDHGLRISSDPKDLAPCTAFVICVPTPLSPQGTPDVSMIEEAIAFIAPHVRQGSLIVLESTSYPGTTEEVVAEPLAQTTGLAAGEDFCVGFSPERVDPGNPEFSLANTPKIVSGLQPCCLDQVTSLYTGVSGSVVPSQGVREAELAKLLENTYRQVNIALMNEMVKFCRSLGIDLHEAIRLASTKPFGYQPFFPGPGVGGHCIPIDPQYLAARVEDRLGTSFRFVELAQEINKGMPAYVVTRLAEELAIRGGSLEGARVLLWGVTYKKDVPDMRESPAEDVVRLLRQRHAIVAFRDPHVPDWAVDGVPVSSQESSEAYDASIYLQHHSAFAGTDPSTTAPLTLDTRGVLSGPGVVGL